MSSSAENGLSLLWFPVAFPIGAQERAWGWDYLGCFADPDRAVMGAIGRSMGVVSPGPQCALGEDN